MSFVSLYVFKDVPKDAPYDPYLNSVWCLMTLLTEINAEIHIDNGVVIMKGVTCKCDDDGFLEASLEINKGDFEWPLKIPSRIG